MTAPLEVTLVARKTGRSDFIANVIATALFGAINGYLLMLLLPVLLTRALHGGLFRPFKQVSA